MTDPINLFREWSPVLLTPIIAIAGIVIGLFQWRVNKNRHKRELFDKRWPQFVAIRDFMRKILTQGKLSLEDTQDFIVETRGCRFLFDNKIKNFVEEIYKKADFLDCLEKELNISEDRDGNLKQQREIKDWFEKQLKEIETRFSKYLQLK